MTDGTNVLRGEAARRVSLGAGDKFRGGRFVESIDWESRLSEVRQGIASRRRRVAPALLLC